MKNMFLLVAGVSLLAGCATKKLKSTPFYEGDEVMYVGSAAWPLISFSDDHFALRPIYSQYKQAGRDGAWDEFNFVWTIVQADTKSDDYRIFPVFWGKDYAERDYQTVFPIYWNGPHYNLLFPIWYYGSTTNSWHFNTLAGLAGASRKGSGYRASWTFPLWYEDNTGLFTTLLYGQTRDSHWVFPLWYRGEKAFISPLYAQGEDGDKSWWAVPALLSWGVGWSNEKSSKNDGSILLGLGSWHEEKTPTRVSGIWWAFPLVQHEWCEELDKPTHRPYAETFIGNYLVGWTTTADELKSLYVFPLFGLCDDGSWLTPLGGQLNCNGTTNTVITPLVGVTSGQQTGGWVFPVWSHDKDADFDVKVALIDSPTLPDCVKVSVVTNIYKKCSEYGKTRLHGKIFHGHDSTVFLLHDVVHSVEGSDYRPMFGALTNLYEISEYSKRGHNLLFNYRSERSETFDLKTKAKLSDEEESSKDTDLKLGGLRIRMRGGKIARAKSKVAVARGLAVTMTALLMKPDMKYVPLSENAKTELEWLRAEEARREAAKAGKAKVA